MITRPKECSLNDIRPAICWHADKYHPDIASVRLRILQPMDALSDRGFTVGCQHSAHCGCSVTIFSKSESAEALTIARASAEAGRTIIYDICDNMFAKPSTTGEDARGMARVREMLRLADAVTCSTATLARQLVQVLPDIGSKIELVPDPLEELSLSTSPPSWLELASLWHLKHFLERHAGSLNLVWFGKCKKGYAGIEHVDRVVRLIQESDFRHRVTLTVISNRRRIYRKQSAAWSIPKFYLPWSRRTFHAAIRMHDVAIIPVEKNDYTLGKTINRPATALMAGLGVIADSLPAYEELRPFIALDDWEAGLRRYIERSPQPDSRIVAAQDHLRGRYGAEVVAARWVEVLDKYTRHSKVT